uniref:Uncharacterized protein n=1 Tax=Rhizophora mucronata TaxID=61149 RepID=A0A2P2PW93_RHIMU
MRYNRLLSWKKIILYRIIVLLAD